MASEKMIKIISFIETKLYLNGQVNYIGLSEPLVSILENLTGRSQNNKKYHSQNNKKYHTVRTIKNITLSEQ
jgi:hypothetical protein